MHTAQNKIQFLLLFQLIKIKDFQIIYLFIDLQVPYRTIFLTLPSECWSGSNSKRALVRQEIVKSVAKAMEDYAYLFVRNRSFLHLSTLFNSWGWKIWQGNKESLSCINIRENAISWNLIRKDVFNQVWNKSFHVEIIFIGKYSY